MMPDELDQVHRVGDHPGVGGDADAERAVRS